MRRRRAFLSGTASLAGRTRSVGPWPLAVSDLGCRGDLGNDGINHLGIAIHGRPFGKLYAGSPDELFAGRDTVIEGVLGKLRWGSEPVLAIAG